MRRNCLERKKRQDGFLNTDLVNISDGYGGVEVLTVCTTKSNDDWIMDSSCTYHMTPRKNFLFNFRTINKGKVLMGNDQTYSVIGIRSVKFQLWNGTLVIENVRLVPKLRKNLLSLGMLDSNGFSYKSQKSDERITGCAKLHQGLYMLQGMAITVVLATVKDSYQTKLWHRRLDHIRMTSLQELCKQG